MVISSPLLSPRPCAASDPQRADSPAPRTTRSPGLCTTHAGRRGGGAAVPLAAMANVRSMALPCGYRAHAVPVLCRARGPHACAACRRRAGAVASPCR